jgi:hypothetical protein
MEVEDMSGAGGNKISIQNSPLTAPLVYVAKSKKPRYTDHGMNWEISTRIVFTHRYHGREPRQVDSARPLPRTKGFMKG